MRMILAGLMVSASALGVHDLLGDEASTSPAPKPEIEKRIILNNDVAPPGEFVSEIVPIKYAKASEIALVLKSLGSGEVTPIALPRNKVGNILSNARNNLSESFKKQTGSRQFGRDLSNGGQDNIIADERTICAGQVKTGATTVFVSKLTGSGNPRSDQRKLPMRGKGESFPLVRL